ncbi:MAG: 3-deoxy-manno-octulosonate cytidylyltransferase [Gammaproteobacteria bacterium]|nr:3-deoxy-manno-octulosonate cytidylyltransferase [Gammaproteobacteria bacterium]
MIDFRVIIPVRYDSTRLPGKPLADIAGKPMMQHVYERAIQSGATSVVIATDDNRIAKAAKHFGATVCMTAGDHASGTDRVAEAAVKLGYDDDDIIVNLQGDEPLIPPKPIHQVANNLAEHDNVKVATLCELITTSTDLLDPNIVKVIMNHRNYALYFSRAPIAWDRSSFPLQPGQELTSTHYRHRGIYAYRVGFLLEYTQWEECDIEHMEGLEQLRTLWNGAKIHVDIANEKIPPDVNTEEDLCKLRKLMGEQVK